MSAALFSAAVAMALSAGHRVDAGPPVGPVDANPPEHPLHITADHLTVLTKDNRTQWSGHVHVVRPPENGQPPVDIRCQLMKTTANPPADAGPGGGEGKVDKVYCDGDVMVEQGDRAGTGDHAIFDNTAGIVTVTGRPKARDGQSHYSADLLTFYVDRNKLDMSGNVVAILPEGGAAPGADAGAKP